MQVAGIQYKIDWRKFKRGYSVFFPCLNDSSSKKEVRAVMKRLRIDVFIKTTIEEGVKGIRVWRV